MENENLWEAYKSRKDELKKIKEELKLRTSITIYVDKKRKPGEVIEIGSPHGFFKARVLSNHSNDPAFSQFAVHDSREEGGVKHRDYGAHYVDIEIETDD